MTTTPVRYHGAAGPPARRSAMTDALRLMMLVSCGKASNTGSMIADWLHHTTCDLNLFDVDRIDLAEWELPPVPTFTPETESAPPSNSVRSSASCTPSRCGTELASTAPATDSTSPGL
jgi:hypothetical protein